MQGIVTILVRDKATNEIVDEIVQKNIITENFVKNIFQFRHLMFKIQLSNAIHKPSIYNTFAHNDTGSLVSVNESGSVFGVPSFSFIDATATSLPILQYAGRFSPPAVGTSRTIKTVKLIINGSSVTYQGPVVAYAELATPCVQTDTQIYDIYYRIMIDYTEFEGGMTKEVFLNTLKFMVSQQYYLSDNGFSRIYELPKLVCNTGETVYELMSFGKFDVTGRLVQSTPSDYTYDSKYRYAIKNIRSSNELAFTSNVGAIYNSLHSTLNPFDYNNYLETGSTDLFRNRSKIQNIFGFNTDSTNPLSEPFLDIDNLATGSGNIVLSGDWQDEEYTTNKNLYFKTLLPKRGIITITKSGAVGTSEYRYTEQSLLGFMNKDKTVSKNMYTVIPVSPLNSISNPSFTLAHNKSILGDITDASFSVEQLSAVIPYDDTSVVIPKKNQVIVYSVAASRYWRITGTFTNIHQVAVISDDIYVACRNTGLYKVNPRINLVATQLTVTGYRTADFSQCNGVCVSHNNKLWALGKDALASYDGSSWTVYDNGSTPLFTNDSTLYSRVGYIKADKETSGDKLIFVYKSTDTSTKVGFFWSPTTSILETNTQPSLNGVGYPKLNKNHLELSDNNLIVISNSGRVYSTPFNTSTAFVNSISTTNNYSQCNLLKSKLNNETIYIRFRYDNYIQLGNNNYVRGQEFYDKNLNLLYSQPSAEYAFHFEYWDNRWYISTKSSTLGYADNHISILLDSGVVFELKKALESGTEMVMPFIHQSALNNTPHGGNYRALARKEYGWNGTSWELNNPNSKVTHSSAQEIINGINVAFNNGASGSSFNINNLYKFGLTRGLLKDNATRAQVTVPVFFSKTAKGNPVLTSNTVPALTSLPTGSVGIHSVKKSKDVFLDESNQVTFPGETGGQFAVGDKQITGDFEITFSCASIANPLCQNRTIFGIGKPHLGPSPMIGFTFNSNSSANVRINTAALEYSTSFLNNPIDVSGLTTASTIGIKRVGATFYITKNGTNYHTLTSSPIRAADARLDVMFNTYHHSLGSSFRSANTFCPSATIVTNGQDNIVKFGNSVAGTEAFDINCKGVVPELPITATLNGVNAPVKIDGSLPVPGSISLDTDTMCMLFDPTDQGKTITIDCTRLWNM